ncbi:glycogen debranching N-terminal domain-containing protein [Rhizobium leguminosarum]|uniref:glycogen debranching N-terminal domain-containing protein n=1 Tax=Rhizobium leguminosarum TaxID=384 RepID=UPI0021BBF77C|nr:glycogen debranching N-terminal domain-containing protein [Rhizobium leguminosarum]
MSIALTTTNGVPATSTQSSPVAQFFIPATASLQERRPRTLKHGDTFAVFDHNGDALSGPGSPEGLFHRGTRYLSHLSLAINGAACSGLASREQPRARKHMHACRI